MQAVMVTNPLVLMLVSVSWNTVPKFELQTIKTTQHPEKSKR